MLISLRASERAMIGCLLAATMILPTQVYAGTIPPGQSPGGSIAPGSSNNTTGTGTGTSETGSGATADAGASQTNGEVAETIALTEQNVRIVIEALPGDVTLPGSNVSDLVQAQVSSEFTLRNAEKTDQSTVVQLPLSDLSGQKDGKGQLMEAQNYVVAVDGTVISPTVVEQINPLGSSEPSVKWMQFPITLTAGQRAVISTTYTTPAAGALPLAQFNYALDTASAWRGKIGQSTVTVQLPYAVNRQNVLTGDTETSAGAKLTGNTLVWSRRGFEPAAKDNLKLTLLAPQVWTNIQNAQAAVKQAPNDAEAQLSLARAYKGALLMDNGAAQGSTAQFVSLADAAYKKALKANPDSAEIHAEYAKFLADTGVAAALNTRRAVPVMTAILDEVDATLKIDPKNVTALGLLANMKQLATDEAQRNTSSAAQKLTGRIDGLAAAAGLTSPATLATAAALIAPTAVVEVTQFVTGTTEVTDTATTAATAVAEITGTVDAGAVVTEATGVASAITSTTATSNNNILRLSSLPQTVLTVACGALILIAIVAAALILLFKRQERGTNKDK